VLIARNSDCVAHLKILWLSHEPSNFGILVEAIGVESVSASAPEILMK
jgi:hypothetical protein